MTNEYNSFVRICEAAEVASEERYHVCSLQGQLHKLGASGDGYPKFFVVVSDHKMMQNINAEMLSVEYNMLCNIIEEDVVLDNQCFTIITLRSDNDQLKKIFIEIFTIMLATLPPKPTNIMLAMRVESLISIFAKLKKRPIHELQGLWAELLLIDQSINPLTVAKAWHSDPKSKYDFTMGSDKVEVKSTRSEQRVHRFSLDQLNPTTSSKLLICSIVVRESAKSDGGLSVFDLYEKICLRITDSETRMHLYNVILDTLGNEFFSAQKKFFDYYEACDRLAFYNYEDVPKIESSMVPEHVTGIKFNSDLSHLKDIKETNFTIGNSELYNALFRIV